MKLQYDNFINGKMTKMAGLEAKAFMKAKMLNIQRGDYILTPKPGDLVTVFPIVSDEETALDIFSELATRQSKLKLIRFKGYYIKPFIRETIAAKRVIVNTRKIYQELSKHKKEYGITTIATKPTVFKNMSYMANLSYLLSGIKAKTFDSGLSMNTKIRGAILETIKKTILDSSSTERDKIVYFKGPFLSNTKVGLTIVDSALLKVWSPVLLFLEWFYKDEVGFKTWLRENKVNIVFDNGAGQHLVLSRSETYQNLPMYNFKYILRLLHVLDGSSLTAIGLSEAEAQEVEDTINTVDDADTVVVTKEELDSMEKLLGDFEDVEDAVSMPDDDILEEFQLIEESEDDLKDATSAKITKDEMSKLFEDVPEEDRPVQIVELHNYTALKKDIETPSVEKLRKKMVKNYGRDIKEVVRNLANHKIEVAKFNNTVDNDYNKSTFILLDKSYRDKLYDLDLTTALTSPSRLSVPAFLQNYSKTDISDREFRGHVLKGEYLTHQGEPLEFEIEIPEVVDNSIFIGGSNKYLTNQDLAKPIKKEDQTVIITMAYNKTILELKGKYATPYDKMLVKTINNFATESSSIKVKTTENLSDFIYDNRMSYRMIHLNKHFGGIRYKENSIDIDFDFRGKSKTEAGTICGNINGTIIMHSPADETFWFEGSDTKYGTTEFILHALELIDADLLKRSTVKKLDNLNFVNACYCRIMARDLPIVLVMLVETPLKDLLERLKDENDLEYSIVRNDKLDSSKLKNDDKFGYIVLSDYTIRIKYNNVVNQLILVPLINMDLTKYNVFDIAHILKDLVGSDNTSMYLENFASEFISGGDERVLEMYNIPSDFTGVFIYAASLYHDYKTSYSSDASNYRLVTPTEVINRIVYELINKEFSNNTARTKRGSRQTIKIPRDAVIKSLQTTMANISEDSNISPFRSIMLKSSKSSGSFYMVTCDRNLVQKLESPKACMPR